MEDLYLVKSGNMQFQCQPEMVGHFANAGYEIYRYEIVRMTQKEINAVVRTQEAINAINKS